MLTMDRMLLAYRKAKADLYYGTQQRAVDLLNYERDLLANLRSLRDRLRHRDVGWLADPELLGSFDVAPKTLRVTESARSRLITAPRDAWLGQALEADAVAEFRLFSRASIDMHVIGALWTGTVGASLDRMLSNAARGNRLRRAKSGEYNWYSIGSFEPYIAPYRKWRDDAFRVIESRLDATEPVTAIVADLESFYPGIDVSFLSSREFFEEMGVHLAPEEARINAVLVRLVQEWQEHVGRLLGHEIKGLPLGYPPSNVIANVALARFDEAIEQSVRPFYYGRYVDDILMVVPEVKGISEPDQIWRWVARQFEASESVVSLAFNGNECIINDPLLGNSDVKLASHKGRLFQMRGESGRDVIRAIGRTIREQASEWRAVPLLPDDPKGVGAYLSRPLSGDGSASPSLAATERISANRAEFALKLRDFEAYARELDPATWIEHRAQFYRAVQDHVLVPPAGLELEQYIPRILSLAVACGDWRHFTDLVESYIDLHRLVVTTCKLELKSTVHAAGPVIATAWAQHIADQVIEVLSVTAVKHQTDSALEAINFAWTLILNFAARDDVAPDWIALQREAFARDLGYQAFRSEVLLGESQLPAVATATGSFLLSLIAVPKALKKPLQLLAAALTSGAGTVRSVSEAELRTHPALVFPTRPLTSAEVFALTRVLSPERPADAPDFGPWLFATRGFSVDDAVRHRLFRSDRNQQLINLPNKTSDLRRVRIALAMYETTDASWVAAVHRRPDLSMARWNSLARLVNEVLQLEQLPSYLMLGELAIPASWFHAVSRKLAARGVSFIAGVEYLHAARRIVRNQVWASLVHDALGFPAAAVYRQDKQKAAIAEEIALDSHAKLRVKPAVAWKRPPVIRHGPLCFALLVCSELTNIEHRASLRGRVDLLMVPEWNRDLRTFEPLVESAALDLHAYVVQVNNRPYGDSRIRAPKRVEYERDIVRVRGGRNNYVVVGEVDVVALRSFQSQARAAVGDFKPLPDGFRLDPFRRVVPGQDQPSD